MSKLNEQELRQGLYHLQRITYPTQIKGLSNDLNRNSGKESAEHALGVLNDAFQHILRREHSYLNFEELYRNVYYLVLHKYGVLLYSSLQNVISQHLLQSVLPSVLVSVNKNFLHVLNRCWDNHHGSMTMMRDSLMYLDRVYTKNVGLEDVYSLGLDLFRSLIVYEETVQATLRDTLLRLVMVERRGELIDRSTFRCVTKMLMHLGNRSDRVYKDNFEGPLLEQSVYFFRTESQKFLKEKNASLYFRSVDMLIGREIERSNQCFDESTTSRLKKVAEDELIKAHMGVIIEMGDSGVVHMIEQKLTEDLSRMYCLLSRVQGGLEMMFGAISQDLRHQGFQLNHEESHNGNVLVYVQNLLDLKEKYDFHLLNSFSDDKTFKKVIASDFESILNLNSKSPEHLSLFIDDRLKKTARGISEEDKVVLFDKTIVLFRCLQDKDLFQQYYKQHLAKRLLTGKGLNEDSEKEVISKFKNECGSHYTRKMEGMFRDMSNSCTITEQFRQYVSDIGDPVQNVDMSLSLRVLTAFYWPTQKVPPPCNLPPVVLTAFETFRTFYLQKHCGRRMTLLPHLGSAELETYFVQSCEDGEGWHSVQTQPCGETRSYILQVSTYQMCVLMLFNERPHWTFQELQVESNIQPKDLQKALQSLVMGKPSQKVLIKQPDSCSVDINDAFYVNTAFTSKSNKVKILSFKNESDPQKQESVKSVTAGQTFEVEAAITRVMKANRVMNHDNLVNEVIESLRQRFVPTKDFVKTRIEVLIEREYIARHQVDKRVYEYIP